MDDDGPIRGEVRLAGYRRVSHGLFLKEREDLSDDQELLRDLQAWLAVLPDDAVFTHITAAHLLGWRLPQLPDQVPVFVAVEGDGRRPRRPGLICSRLVRETSRRTARGMPVDEPEEILLRAARDLGTLDLTVLLDSALQLGHVDTERMNTILASRRPGTRNLRAAWALATPRCESAGETVLRAFHVVMEVRVAPQVELHDAAGRFVGRADLLLEDAPFVHEYDGAVHRSKVQHRTDLRRERGWNGTPYARNGYTLDDLLNHPQVLMHELDRLLDRPHQLSRLRRWRKMVDNSLYSDVARLRMMNRWRRQMGVVDWSGVA